MKGRPHSAVLIGLALAGCGGGGEVPGATEDAAPAARQPVEHPAEAETEPLDSAAVASALAEDEALDAENRATYEARLRSMAGYAECMAQARGLPPETSARIQAACEGRRESP